MAISWFLGFLKWNLDWIAGLCSVHGKQNWWTPRWYFEGKSSNACFCSQWKVRVNSIFSFFFNSHYLRKVIFSFHFGNVSTALSKPKLLIFILTDMVSEDLQPSSLMNRLPKFLVIFFSISFSNFSMFKLVLAHYASNVAWLVSCWNLTRNARSGFCFPQY